MEGVRKQTIKELEGKVNRKHSVEVKVYGGGTGLETLADYLYRDGKRTDEAEKRSYEYAVFLGFLLNKSKLNLTSSVPDSNKVFYGPSRGRGRQSTRVPGLFTEPALPRYDAEDIWSKYHDEYAHLLNPENDTAEAHVKPDFLITDKDVSHLPWSADTRPNITDERKLKEWVAHGKIDEVEEALGLDEQLSSAAEAYSAISKYGEKEDPAKTFEKWEDFQSQARYLVEVKHQPLTEMDYSQIIWYTLVYKIPMTIISAKSVNSSLFKQELERLPTDVEIIDGLHISSSEDVQNAFADIL